MLVLLERRHAQGGGGATAGWLAEQLHVLRAAVDEVLAVDDRFDRIACGQMSWWWSAAERARRDAEPG